MSDKFCVVFVTTPAGETAESIAEHLVKERLVACCNLLPGVRSIYHWKGEVCRDDEVLLVMKTRRDLFEKLRARVVELHSYDVPEVIALPIVAGHQPYLDWLYEETVK
jgi:uncharacterized protein involved in tolerance to divalent cations